MNPPGLAVGVDLVEIRRVDALLAAYGERFTGRVFTPAELADCAGRPASLAARWAAKEATAKALGTGIGAVGFQDIETLRDTNGRPQLHLYGEAAASAQALGLNVWSISLAHDGGFAIAFVTAIGS